MMLMSLLLSCWTRCVLYLYLDCLAVYITFRLVAKFLRGCIFAIHLKMKWNGGQFRKNLYGGIFADFKKLPSKARGQC